MLPQALAVSPSSPLCFPPDVAISNWETNVVEFSVFVIWFFISNRLLPPPLIHDEFVASGCFLMLSTNLFNFKLEFKLFVLVTLGGDGTSPTNNLLPTIFPDGVTGDVVLNFVLCGVVGGRNVVFFTWL